MMFNTPAITVYTHARSHVLSLLFCNSFSLASDGVRWKSPRTGSGSLLLYCRMAGQAATPTQNWPRYCGRVYRLVKVGDIFTGLFWLTSGMKTLLQLPSHMP